MYIRELSGLGEMQRGGKEGIKLEQSTKYISHEARQESLIIIAVKFGHVDCRSEQVHGFTKID